MLVGRDKVEIFPALSKVHFNGIEISLHQDQPLEVYHEPASQRSSIGAYKVDAETLKVTVHFHHVNIFISASSGIVVSVSF